jgi:hypothetical protein
MPRGQSHMAGGVSDGKVYLFGGQYSTTTDLTPVLRYDPALDPL